LLGVRGRGVLGIGDHPGRDRVAVDPRRRPRTGPPRPHGRAEPPGPGPCEGGGPEVGVHMMPGLPGSNLDRDLESFRELFTDPAYRPDFLKIYPTLVLPGTALHGLWKSGRYTPLRTDEAVALIARVKAIVPRWCRIQRVQREIGAPDIEDGVTRGDLRVLAKERLRSQGLDCHCIRCREVGFRGIAPRPEALSLLRI